MKKFLYVLLPCMLVLLGCSSNDDHRINIYRAQMKDLLHSIELEVNDDADAYSIENIVRDKLDETLNKGELVLNGESMVYIHDGDFNTSYLMVRVSGHDIVTKVNLGLVNKSHNSRVDQVVRLSLIKEKPNR